MRFYATGRSLQSQIVNSFKHKQVLVMQIQYNIIQTLPFYYFFYFINNTLLVYLHIFIKLKVD